MRRLFVAILFALGLSGGPAMADALAPTTTTLTFTGHFASGRDNAGLFGPWGSNLAGKAFTATYEVVTFAGSSTSAGINSLTIGAPTTISFSMKINNRTQNGTANALGSISTQDGLGGVLATGIDRIEASVRQTLTTGALTKTFDLSASVQSGLNNILTDNLTSAIPSLIYSVVAGDSASGYFQMSQSGSASSVLSYGVMKVEQLSVVTNIPVAAVPEPGEWAMMLAGLGVIATVARRRRR